MTHAIRKRGVPAALVGRFQVTMAKLRHAKGIPILTAVSSGN